MADDFRGDKTEAPTPRRRQEARERGNVPRSADLSSVLLLMAAFALLWFWGSDLMVEMGGYMRDILSGIDRFDPTVEGTTALANETAIRTGQMLLPILGTLLVLGVGINLLQVGFLLSARPITPDLARINPGAGFGRIFSLSSGMRLAMSTLKIAVVGAGSAWIIAREVAALGAVSELEGWGILSAVSRSVFWTAMKLCLMLLALGILDYLYQRWQNEQDLRMTRQEVKDEMKRYEGDPLVRQRRQQLARQLVRERMMKAVEKADVVITNPTELAVALRYEASTMDAPQVVAKGARLAALRIRELASKAGVPIVERKPLAQALYKACRVGDRIPGSLYRAVVEVLAQIYALNPARYGHFGGASPGGAGGGGAEAGAGSGARKA